MLNGIKRKQQIESTTENRGGIQRIVIRYASGRTVTVSPDAGSGNFSEDDAKELKKIFDKSAATMEWSEVSTRASM